MPSNVSDKQIRRAIAAVAKAALPAAEVVARWDKAFAQAGQSLNVVRAADDSIRAVFVTNTSGARERLGEVSFEESDIDSEYTRADKAVYQIRLVWTYADDPDANGETSEDYFSDAVEALTAAIGKKPKLGLGRMIESANELQLAKKFLFQFGDDLLHVADFLLTVNLWRHIS